MEAANIAEKQENANKVKFTALFWGKKKRKPLEVFLTAIREIKY